MDCTQVCLIDYSQGKTPHQSRIWIIKESFTFVPKVKSSSYNLIKAFQNGFAEGLKCSFGQ